MNIGANELYAASDDGQEPPAVKIRETSALAVRLSEAAAAERRRACRALLQRPLLTADGPSAAEYTLVRRHAKWLREWFARNPGWSLLIDAEVARLRKMPSRLDDGSRPARDASSSSAFTRRRYMILCLALAALERSDRQITLGNLAKNIESLAASDHALVDAGLVMNLDSSEHRKDLVQAVRLLMTLRVLVRIHGDEQQYLTHHGDVLYNIQRPVLVAMLCVRRPPSMIDATDLEGRLAALTDEIVPETDDGRNRKIRSELTRRLLEDPVVYFDDLSPDQKAYLQSQRAMLVRQVEEATGLIAEIRREGIAMADEGGELTDIGIPEEGTDGHLLLLLADFLAGHARGRPGVPVGWPEIEHHTKDLIARFSRYWRRDASDPGAEIRYTTLAVERLIALGLAKKMADGILPLPAVGRYAVGAKDADTGSEENNASSSLWEDQA